MSKIPLGTPGFVYLMSSPSMPGLMKIGATTDEPINRAKQLSASTSAAMPFHVLYHRAVPDVNAAESAMHSSFAAQRVNEGREFFRVSLYEAARTLDALCGGTFGHFEPRTPWAELFATFPDDGTARQLDSEERSACARLSRDLG